MSEQTLPELVREIIADVLVGTHGIQPRAIEHTRMTIQNRIEEWLAKQAAPGPALSEEAQRLATKLLAVPPPQWQYKEIQDLALRVLETQPAAAPAEPSRVIGVFPVPCTTRTETAKPIPGLSAVIPDLVDAAQRDRELIERAVKGTLDTVRSFACEADERSILMLNPKKLASAIAIAEKVSICGS